MTVDYEALDAELDAEIQKMYSEDDSASDAPEESGTASEEPEAVVQEAEDATPSTDEPAETPSEPVVPEFRYKEAVRAMNRAQAELAEYRKAEAQRDQVIEQLQAEVQALKAGSSPQEDAPDFDEAKELYPELVNPLLKEIDSLKKQLASVQNEVGTVRSVADRYQQAEAMSAEERHFAEIRAVHPDAFDLAKTDDFQSWKNAQAPIIQYALDQGTAKDVVAALNLYKADTGKQPSAPHRPDRLAAAKDAAAPTIKGASKPDSKPTLTPDAVAKMTMAEFAKHEAEIDAAIARGEFY
jgi:prefoldin subunit 5